MNAIHTIILLALSENGDQNPKTETTTNPNPDWNIMIAENRCANVHLSDDAIEAGVL